MTAVVAALLAGTAVLLAAQAVHARRPRAARARPRESGRLVLALLARLIRLLPAAVGALARRDSRGAIERAGLADRITPRDVAAARVACLIAAALLTPRLAGILPARMLVLALPLLFWSAAELPLFLLARRGARRGAAMRAALPDALDLLRACLAAGLPLRRSLSLVADHCAEPVATEFACVSAEVAYGVPQSMALDGLAARNPEPEVRALVSAIHQTERGGSPLAPVIAAQARDARLALNRAIVERGARAGPKIQLVVSATIVPGALIAFAAIVINAIARGEIRIL